MNTANFYALLGVGLFCLGMYTLIIQPHLLRKILAINIMGSGVFLLLVSLAKRTMDGQPDAVPHAMVITGIVVAISATAMALTLLLKLNAETGRTELPIEGSESSE